MTRPKQVNHKHKSSNNKQQQQQDENDSSQFQDSKRLGQNRTMSDQNQMMANNNRRNNNNHQNNYNNNNNDYYNEYEESKDQSDFDKENNNNNNILNENRNYNNNMYLDDPQILFVGDIVDYQNSYDEWVDARIILKNKGNMKIQQLKTGQQEWIDKTNTTKRIVKQWKPNQKSSKQYFLVNQRLAILDREINETSRFINKDNYFEARIIQVDDKLKEIYVTYTPQLSNDYDEWILQNSLRIKPISFITNYNNNNHSNSSEINNNHYSNKNRNYNNNYNNDHENKKQLKKNAKSYESQQVKEYKENILKKGLVLREMESDGNCLFRSVADQLYGDQSLHGIIRKYVADYLQVEKEYFINFICSISDENTKKSSKKRKNKVNAHKTVNNKNNNGVQDHSNQKLQKEEIKIENNKDSMNNNNTTTTTKIMNENDIIFNNYINELRENGTWGDDVEIQIISEIYKRGIDIYYAFEENPMRCFHENQIYNQNDIPIRLSYHGKCHYNSIKSIQNERLIQQKIGIIEEQAIIKAQERQNAISLIQNQNQINDNNINCDLQNICRQKFELFQNCSNTDELYNRLIQEQYQSFQFDNNGNGGQFNGDNNNINVNQEMMNVDQNIMLQNEQQHHSQLYQSEQYNLMNNPQYQELALQLALEESRYMMENQNNQDTQNNNNTNNLNQDKDNMDNQMKQIDEGMMNTNKNEVKEIQQNNILKSKKEQEMELERMNVINAVCNVGFTIEQAQIAIDIVGPNEDLIVNYILENLL